MDSPKRALVIVPFRTRDGFPPLDRCPLSMLHLVDRPIIQHVCESLVRQGVTSIDWVHCRPADEARKFLGNGERWGVTFSQVAADTLPEAIDLVRTALAESDEPVLVGHADCIPTSLPLTRHATRFDTVVHDSAMPRWTGWAVVAPRARVAAANDEFAFADSLLATGLVRRLVTPPPTIQSFCGYLSASHSLLAEQGPRPVVSPRAKVHAAATLIGPVYVAPGARIEAGAVVGPFVAVGPDCVVARNTRIRHAAVLPKTYVGTGLRLCHAVVDGGRVVQLTADGLSQEHVNLRVGCLATPPLTGMARSVVRNTRKMASRLGRLSLRGRPDAASVRPTKSSSEAVRLGS